MKEIKDKETLLVKKSMPKKIESKKLKEEIERDLEIESRKKLIDGDLRLNPIHELKSIEEKVHFLIDICADEKDLLKIKKVLIEFENNDLIVPKGKEMIANDKRKIKRR